MQYIKKREGGGSASNSRDVEPLLRYSVSQNSAVISTVTPPGGPNSFNFMQFLGNFGEIVCWRPPGELAPPPRGNPRSATGY